MVSALRVFNPSSSITNIHQGVPSLPKVAVRYNTNGVSQLILDIWRHGDHEPNELALDSSDLISRQLVVSIFVLICSSAKSFLDGLVVSSQALTVQCLFM